MHGIGNGNTGWVIPITNQCLEFVSFDYNRIPLEDLKKELHGIPPERRKAKLLNAIEELRDKKLCLDQIDVCFRVLQDLALSPRVSNLNSLKFYARRTSGNSPRPPSLEFTKHLFRHEIEKEEMFCISEISEFPSLNQLGNQPKWIIVKYGELKHQALLRVWRPQQVYQLQIFDSLGVTAMQPKGEDEEPSTARDCKTWLLKVAKKLTVDGQPPNIEYIKGDRIKDHVSCTAFVIEDLRVARELLAEEKPLFESGKAHPRFFRISQNPDHLDQVPTAVLRKHYLFDSKTTTNSKAMLIALDIFKALLEENVRYPDANAIPDYESEGDDREGCIIA